LRTIAIISSRPMRVMKRRLVMLLHHRHPKRKLYADVTVITVRMTLCLHKSVSGVSTELGRGQCPVQDLAVAWVGNAVLWFPALRIRADDGEEYRGAEAIESRGWWKPDAEDFENGPLRHRDNGCKAY
jgi:hypothetical protein